MVRIDVIVLVGVALVGALVILRRQSEPDGKAYANWLMGGDVGSDPAADPELQAGQPDTAYTPSADPTQDTVPDQLPSVTETFIVTAQEAATDAVSSVAAIVGLATPAPDQDTATRNERAFLDMIAYAEGTAGPNGYRTLFGGGLVDNLADHPRQFFTFTNKRGETLRTSAAGRYQFLAKTWDELRARLDLPDFGPQSQDRAALELVRQRGALADVRAGRVAAAVHKVASTWASLPGAGYAQGERKLSDLVATYSAAGGNLEA